MNIEIPDSVISALSPIIRPILKELLKEDYSTRVELLELQQEHAMLKSYVAGLPGRVDELDLVRQSDNAKFMLKDGSNPAFPDSAPSGGGALYIADGAIKIDPVIVP